MSPPMGQKAFCIQHAKINEACESNVEKVQDNSLLSGDGKKEIRQLIKVRELSFAVVCFMRAAKAIQLVISEHNSQELEERDGELKRLQETRKQLILKLCNVQKQTESTEQKLKKMEGEHEKAVRAIQGFIEREQQMRDMDFCKDQKIQELEAELRKRRNAHIPVSLKDLGVKNADDRENESCKQVTIAICDFYLSFVDLRVSELRA